MRPLTTSLHFCRVCTSSRVCSTENTCGGHTGVQSKIQQICGRRSKQSKEIYSIIIIIIVPLCQQLTKDPFKRLKIENLIYNPLFLIVWKDLLISILDYFVLSEFSHPCAQMFTLSGPRSCSQKAWEDFLLKYFQRKTLLSEDVWNTRLQPVWQRARGMWRHSSVPRQRARHAQKWLLFPPPPHPPFLFLFQSTKMVSGFKVAQNWFAGFKKKKKKKMKPAHLVFLFRRCHGGVGVFWCEMDF